MAGTGWEPYRWRDDETLISTWTSLNARGIVNKVLSNVTLDEKRACVPAEPERLAIDVAIIHFRCADVPLMTSCPIRSRRPNIQSLSVRN